VFNVHLFERATESGVSTFQCGRRAAADGAFSVREALAPGGSRIRARDWSFDLGCRFQPEAVFWPSEGARNASARSGDRAGSPSRGCEMDWRKPPIICGDEGQPGVLVTVGRGARHAPSYAGARWCRPRAALGQRRGGNLEATAVAGPQGDDRVAGPPSRRCRSRPASTARQKRARRMCCAGWSGCCSSRPLAGRSSRCSARWGPSSTSLARNPVPLRSSCLLVDSRPGPLDRVRLADVIDGTANVGIHHSCLSSRCSSSCGAALTCDHDTTQRRGLRAVATRPAAVAALCSIGRIGSSPS